MDSDEQTNTKNKVDSAETLSPRAATAETINSSSNHENSQKPALVVSVPKEKRITSPGNHTLQQAMRLVDASDYEDEKSNEDSNSNARDASLSKAEMEKRVALIKAWEESKKSKTDNKAYKKKSAIGSWETTKRASIEDQLKHIEEEFEKEKAECGEKIKNKIVEMHKEAAKKRAMIEAKREEEILKIEEMAAKFRATGNLPKSLFGCFAFLFFF